MKKEGRHQRLRARPQYDTNLYLDEEYGSTVEDILPGSVAREETLQEGNGGGHAELQGRMRENLKILSVYPFEVTWLCRKPARTVVAMTVKGTWVAWMISLIFSRD